MGLQPLTFRGPWHSIASACKHQQADAHNLPRGHHTPALQRSTQHRTQHADGTYSLKQAGRLLTICSADTTFCIVLCAAKPTATVDMEPKVSSGCTFTPKATMAVMPAVATMPCIGKSGGVLVCGR